MICHVYLEVLYISNLLELITYNQRHDIYDNIQLGDIL